jgi:hypothetical protein
MNQQLWVVIAYNNDDDHDAETIGVFSTKDKAIEKILGLVHMDYLNASADEELDTKLEAYNCDIDKWAEVKLFFSNILHNRMELGNPLSYLNYKLSVHTLS